MVDAAPAPRGSITVLLESFGPYELYMLALSAFSLVVLAGDTLLPLSSASHEVLGITDTALCVLFFGDFLRNVARARDRRRYLLREGWLDLISSIPAVDWFRLGRISRVARLVRLMRAVRSVRTIGLVISRRRRESALLAAATLTIVLTVFASLAVLQFEQHPEANIRTGGDALWWAFATITTVGYGDRFPVTLEGRLIAAMLMAAGVALFGTLSGLIAAWFLHDGVPSEEDATRTSTLDQRIATLTVTVEGLKKQLESRPHRDG
ncbi:MAG: ion transporter [Gemmatimonadales bacterium]|nr:ion transporter [Gemmatimonadales bacterium]